MKDRTQMLVLGGSALGVLMMAVLVGATVWQLNQPVQPRPAAVAFGGGPVAEMPMDPGPVPMLDNMFAAPAGPGAPGIRIAPDRLDQARKAVPVSELTVAGPFTRDNLTVFLIEGPDRLDQKVLTLQEGIEQGLVTVREGFTAIENRSDMPLFVQAGDIIKGGIQDRTIPDDYMIPPGKEPMPVMVMCVEQGRSHPRAGESSSSFQVACERLPTTELRLAALRHAQIDVWAGVQRTQQALTRNLAGSVQSPLSATSLQLTLEHPLVWQGTDAMLNDLARIPDKHAQAIGMVTVVNGKIRSADLYASNDLFRRTWPRMVKAASVEALSAPRGREASLPTREQVISFLTEAEQGTATQQTTNRGFGVVRQESPNVLLIDSCDARRDNLVMHRSILVKN